MRKDSKYIRWVYRLSAYDFDISYHPGEENLVPDALSRLPLPADSEAVEDCYMTHLIRQVRSQGITAEEIRSCMEADPLLPIACRYVEQGWPHKAKIPEKLRPFFHVRQELEISDGLLLRGGRLVLPAALTYRVLRMAHTGHPGMVRMKRCLRQTYWWPLLDSQVEQVVKCCEGCQKSAKAQPPDPIPKMCITKLDHAWSRIGIDIAGPFNTVPHRKQFVVSVVDHYTGFPEVLLTMDIHSSRIVTWLCTLFACYGYPDELVWDNGPQFTSQEFQVFLEEGGVKELPASMFNPQENGVVERWNQTLKTGVQAFCAMDRLWDLGILELLMQHHSMPSTP